jgi:hypothetical protein
MSLTEYAVNFFVALFALLDPIGNVPVFAAATAGALAAGRRWVAVYISLFAFLFMTFFFFTRPGAAGVLRHLAAGLPHRRRGDPVAADGARNGARRLHSSHVLRRPDGAEGRGE